MRIDDSEFRKDTIGLLKEFLEDANSSRSVAETVKVYKSIYGKNTVKHITYLLDCIDTNYVTITNNDAKLFDGYVPTPLELYEDFVETFWLHSKKSADAE